MKCKKCGTELLDGQKFCPRCGIRIEDDISNKSLDIKSKRKNKKKVILSIAIPVLIVLIGIVCYVIFRKPAFEGTYKIASQIGVNITDTYTFQNGEFVYKSAYDYNSGTYELDNNKLVLTSTTDSTRTDTEWIRHNNCITMAKQHFDEEINLGSESLQTFNCSYKASSKGYTWNIREELILYPSGKYEWHYTSEETTVGMSYQFDEEGTYEISGDKLLKKPNDSDDADTWLIIDKIIYTYVFEKTK